MPTRCLMDDALLAAYVKDFDHVIGAWGKKSHATDFAAVLAAELKLNPKAVVTEKDGKNHRVFLPLIALYWHPTLPDRWHTEYVELARKVRLWATL